MWWIIGLIFMYGTVYALFLYKLVEKGSAKLAGIANWCYKIYL